MSEEAVRPSESVEEKVDALDASTAGVEPPAPAVAEKDEDAEPGAKRLTPEQWAEIETHWECETMRAIDICKKYSISATSLTKHFRRHKILRGSKKHLIKKAAEVKIMGAVAASSDPLAVAYEQKRKNRITQTRETFMNQSAALTSRWNKIEKEILDGDRTEAQCANDFKAMRHAILAAKTIAETRLEILNADADVDEAKLPTLVFRDLGEDEIQAMSNSDDDDFDLDLPPPHEEPEDDEIIEEGEPSPSS